MFSLTLSSIAERLQAVEASYQRQLTLAGKPGYDPALTIQLKQDLDWLSVQRAQFVDGIPQADHSTIKG